MQTHLERKGIEARAKTLVRNEYNRNDEYSENHKNAISDGDVKGKNIGTGSHTHSLPDQTKPSVINYSNFNTSGGGNKYDIEGFNGNGGRNFLKTISLYSEENPYGEHLIDDSANIADGQIFF